MANGTSQQGVGNYLGEALVDEFWELVGSRGRAVLEALLGLAVVGSGVWSVAAAGAGWRSGLVTGSVGVLFIVSAWFEWPQPSHTIPMVVDVAPYGTPERGVSFSLSRAKVVWFAIVSIVIGLGLGWIVVADEAGLRGRFIQLISAPGLFVLAAVIMLFSAVAARRNLLYAFWRQPHVVLSPHAITVAQPRGDWVISWDNLSDVKLLKPTNDDPLKPIRRPEIALVLCERFSPSQNAASRTLHALDRWLGDVRVPVKMLNVNPQLLFKSLRFYLANPDARAELTERNGIDHLHRQMLLERYTRHLDLDPDDVRVLLERGYVYRLLERYDHALADLDRAVELDPDQPDVWIYRAIAYLSLKRYDDALADLDRAVDLNSDPATALVVRARTYLSLKRSEEAMADLDRAAGLNPERSEDSA